MFCKKTVSLLLSCAMLFSAYNLPGITANNHFTANAETSADFTTSDNGIKFICEHEGFHETCYWDYTQSSIGYGTKCTGSDQQPHTSGMHTITKEEAMEAMRSQIADYFEKNVRRQTKDISMNQNQFDALVSLCYNTGGGNTIISDSPLVKYLKGELSKEDAAAQYSEYYVKAGGSRLQGLVNRRNDEAVLFFTEPAVITGISAPEIIVSSNNVCSSDNLTISWEPVQNAESYWIYIYQNGIEFMNTPLGQQTSYTASYPSGNYSAYIVASYGKIEEMSSIEFTVYDPVPEKPVLKMSKTVYSPEENEEITWDAVEYADYYWLHVYRNNEDYINKSLSNSLSYSDVFPTGKYKAYIAAGNSTGEEAAFIEFEVAEAVSSTTSKPAVTTTTTAASTAAAISSTTKPVSSSVKVSPTNYGDANCDNTIDLSDSVLIMQAISNPSKYGSKGTDKTHITDVGIANGDVCGNDGLTSADALAIQRFKLGLIRELPI